MRTMLISDNNDTLVGMRLGGVKSVLASNREEVIEAIEFALSKEEVGILIVTERVFDMAKAELLDIRMNRRTPLIVEIPDRHGQIRDDNYITQYINESVGIKL
ncbi:ATP synthase, subunit F [Filifactor alocis ATCC 35896]|uniref:ATP synthase, subunit F n=1 Tax=Filifactor alocis (strain ATCC 35896 / CCUG 47790 / D40 B5) TaxID=546269 RepID=D6GT61_FILAD|nr:V-type ATP synthase subunit F [Filifactor alocis]EFE28046.1 ATP synthase, subunit F [Filifactor alocis ATCC 35896]